MTLTPAGLWKGMTLEQRRKAALAFWMDDQSADDQMQATLLIAQRKKFRPKTVAVLDDERKARHLSTIAGVTETIAARALVAYHLTEERPMMGAFLDAVGISHENGLIKDDQGAPDPAKIRPAATLIAGQYPAENVALYLNTLLCQDPSAWAPLEDAPERLGGH